MAAAGGHDSGGPFVISATLAGHQADVRAICEVSDDSVATGSLDQVAKLWTARSPNDFECVQTYQGHNRYIYSVAFIPPTVEFANGLVATASVDTNVHLYLPDVGDGPVRQLIGHSMAVCCVRPGHDGTVLTSSWDGTAKVWGVDGTCRLTLEGHTKSVLAIIAHPKPGMYITCSADLTIRVWNRDACMGAMTGHNDVPRDLAILGDGTLVSCANDGSVKFWSLDRPGPALRTLSAHSGHYIYSIAVFPAGGPADFATCGEDGTVAVWRDAAKVQTIAMPCNSVWAVAARANGDLLVACNDGFGRVFTADAGRRAPDDVVAGFIEHVAQVALARAGEAEEKIGDLDTSSLVGPERLASPGDSDGQIIMVRDGGKVMAHSWSAAENAWQTIGEVADAKDTKSGPAPPGWQHFDVELDGRKMVCRHKTGDNPFMTAQRFLDENELDQSLLDQVVDFIERNAAAPTLEFAQAPTAPVVPGAYVPGRAEQPAQARRPASAHFPITELVAMAAVKLEGLTKKLAELNVGVSPELQLDASASAALSDALAAVGGNPGAPLGADVFARVAPACAKLLSWPPGDARVPGLDAVRVLMANGGFRSAAFAQEGTPLSLPEFKAHMLQAAGLSGDDGGAVESAACQMLALRAVANAFGGDVGMQDCMAELLPLLEKFDPKPLNKHSQIAFSTILLNAAVSAVRRGDAFVAEIGGELLRVLGRSLGEVQRAAKPEPEAVYRLVAAVGTLVASGEVMHAVALSLPEVAEAVRAAAGGGAGKVAEAASDVLKALA